MQKLNHCRLASVRPRGKRTTQKSPSVQHLPVLKVISGNPLMKCEILYLEKSKSLQASTQVPSNCHWQNNSQAQKAVIMQNTRKGLLSAVLATFYRTLGPSTCSTVLGLVEESPPPTPQ